MSLALALAFVLASAAGATLAGWWWPARTRRAPRLEPGALREGLLQVLALEGQTLAPDTCLLEDGESPLLASGVTSWRLRLFSESGAGASGLPVKVAGEALVVCGGAELRPALAARTGQPVFQLLPGEPLWASRAAAAAPELRRLLALAVTRLAQRHSGRRLLELQPDERDALRRPVDPAAARWASVVRWRVPVATYGLLGLLLAVFVLEVAWGGSTSLATLDAMGALSASAVRSGELARLLASACLHIGPQHLLFNSMALLAFGPLLEGCLGRPRFLLLWVLSALGGGLASTAFAAPEQLSAGASGALWGLMGAMFGLGLERSRLLPPFVREALRSSGARLLLLNGAISFLPGISLTAHFGGGLVGFALVVSGALTAGLAERPRARSAPARLLLGACALALFASLAGAWSAGRPWDLSAPPRDWVRQTVAGTGLSIELPPGWRLTERQRAGAAVTYATSELGSAPLTVVLQVSPADDATQASVAHETYALPKGAGRGEGWNGVLGRERFRLDVLQWQGTSAAWRSAVGRFAASLRRANPAPDRAR